WSSCYAFIRCDEGVLEPADPCGNAFVATRRSNKRRCGAGLSSCAESKPTNRENQFAETLPDFWAARSRSITARQPTESSARCLYMQAVIAGIFGISLLQRRN